MKLDKPVPGGPCWTELGTSDLEAAKRFYADLFGWRPETDPRQEAGGYTVAHLGDAPVAAISPLYQESQPVAWNVSFAVADADTAVDAVQAAGGTVVLGPMDVFDVGRFAVAFDPTGAAFQLWQARAFPGAGLFNAPGALGWVELLTRAPDRAVEFYTTVFDWTVNASEHYTQWGIEEPTSAAWWRWTTTSRTRCRRTGCRTSPSRTWTPPRTPPSGRAAAFSWSPRPCRRAPDRRPAGPAGAFFGVHVAGEEG